MRTTWPVHVAHVVKERGVEPSMADDVSPCTEVKKGPEIVAWSFKVSIDKISTGKKTRGKNISGNCKEHRITSVASLTEKITSGAPSIDKIVTVTSLLDRGHLTISLIHRMIAMIKTNDTRDSVILLLDIKAMRVSCS